MLKISSPTSNSQTITIRPSLQPKSNVKNQQQIIVIPQSMLVNGCISTKDLKNIIDTDSKTIKTMENRSSLKRPLPQASSDYGSDSETSSEHSENKPARKRANLDHLSPEEKLMRRKLKNRVAAQNARDKKRAKMEDMEIELQRIKSHAKALEAKYAELARENERLVEENNELRCSEVNVRLGHGEANGPLVVQRSPESAAGTGLSSGRWSNGLDGGLTDQGLQVVVERDQSQKTGKEAANQEESKVADVMGKIINEDFSSVDDDESIACEQILDKFLQFTPGDENSVKTENILDTAWEETFGGLFPDLEDCTF